MITSMRRRDLAQVRPCQIRITALQRFDDEAMAGKAYVRAITPRAQQGILVHLEQRCDGRARRRQERGVAQHQHKIVLTPTTVVGVLDFALARAGEQGTERFGRILCNGRSPTHGALAHVTIREAHSSVR